MLVGPYPPPWGGIAVHLRALHRLAEDAGIDAEILDIGEGHASRTGEDGVTGAGSHASFAAGLSRAALRGDSLHVHIPGNNLKSWLVALAGSRARLHGGGALLTVHSGVAPAFLDSSSFARRIARSAATGFRRILCTNSDITGVLRSCGVPGARLEVVSPFLGQPLSTRGEGNHRTRFSPLLSCALSPGPQYGEGVLLQALAILSKRLPRVGCLAFGPSTAEATFLARVRAHGVDRQVVPLGELEHDACLDAISKSDAFLRPTLADGDSLSVREAIAMGRRVVASDAAPRPAGTVLFRRGDPASLASAIEEALARPAPGPAQGSGASAARILDAWSQLGIVSKGGLR
ncbi:glycosyltransferase family 4 protein [Vulgatibacter incomptus]|uniref:Glycosyltransferase n=1 Tax=Vulgatibacter incomptus TaxID=1391653 RepID=A0A0K1PAY5_9BACT|nr:glycosyltransferase family 4 protein [Vulgatibacter incomptus]AKU90667.1 Glycosyltransferase [Vulgatibacter incomptus]